MRPKNYFQCLPYHQRIDPKWLESILNDYEERRLTTGIFSG